MSTHRGRPTLAEQELVDNEVRERLLGLVDDLVAEGFTTKRAASLVAFVALEVTFEGDGERWAAHRNAYATVLNVLRGNHAKEWSARAVLEAVAVIEEVA